MPILVQLRKAPGLAIQEVRVLNKFGVEFRVFQLVSWSISILGFSFMMLKMRFGCELGGLWKENFSLWKRK